MDIKKYATEVLNFMPRHQHSFSQMQTKEGLQDLNLIIEELTKIHPNPIKLKEFTKKYGIDNYKDPTQLMEDIILFLDQQKIHKIHSREI